MSGFCFRRTTTSYPALKAISGFMLDIRLSLSLSNDGKHGQVGRDYSSCVKGCWFGSNHDCIGFVNTADTLMF